MATPAEDEPWPGLTEAILAAAANPTPENFPTKTCKECRQELPKSAFPKLGGRTCISCTNKLRLALRWNDEDGLVAHYKKRKLAEQKGKCAICSTDKPTWGGLALDHDHRYGANPKTAPVESYRGILCAQCNLLLEHIEKWLNNPVPNPRAEVKNFLLGFGNAEAIRAYLLKYDPERQLPKQWETPEIKLDLSFPKDGKP